MAFPAPTMSMGLPRLGDFSDSKRRCQDQERSAALYMACGTPFSDYLSFVFIHSGVSYKTGWPRGEVRVQCCTWLLNLAPCYWVLGVVEQSVLIHVQSDTCCLKKVVVALPRLCGRLADPRAPGWTHVCVRVA